MSELPLITRVCRWSRILETSVYTVESEVEHSHWWFAGRRQLLAKQIRSLDLPRDAAILDIGSGTGTNLRMLADLGFGNVTGIDKSLDAIRFCDEKGLGKVGLGDACSLPWADDSYDLVLATDIVEHVDDDALALRELRRVLRPGGRALLTVPAFPSLWGRQDDVSHHKRRYRRGELEARLGSAGLALQSSFYFNYLLFAPIWLARQLTRILEIQLDSENQLNARALNRLFALIFALDVWSAPVLRPGFGVSLFASVERGANAAVP